MAEDSVLTVPASSGVLSYLDDLGGGTATLSAGVEHGTLALASDGSFSYAPTPDYVGADQFSVVVTRHPGWAGSVSSSPEIVLLNVRRMGPPTDIITTPDGEHDAVTLHWTDPPGATRIDVYYASSHAVSPSNYTSFMGGRMLRGVTSGVTIPEVHQDPTWFVLVAVDALGESAPSMAVAGHPNLRYMQWYAEASAAPPAQAAIAADDPGDSLATWTSGNGLFASYRQYGNGSWSASTLLSTTSISPNTGFEAAFDDSNQAMVLFDQPTVGQPTVWYRRFNAQSGWTPAAPVTSGTSSSLGFASLTRGPGASDFYAAIDDFSASTASIVHFDPDAGWSAPVAWPFVGYPEQLSTDALGNVFVPFIDSSDLVVAEWSSAAGWSSATITTSGGFNAQPVLGVRPDGSALVAYLRYASGAGAHVYAATRSVTGTWSPPVEIDGGAVVGFNVVRAAVSDAGYAAVLWRQQLPQFGWLRVVGAEYDPMLGWQSPICIDQDNLAVTVDSQDLDLAITPGGTATAVWDVNVGPAGDVSGYLSYARMFPDGGWQQGQGWGTTYDSKRSPKIAVGRSGAGAALWIDAANATLWSESLE